MTKQSIGVDVAKDTLVCCKGWIDTDQQTSFSKPNTFANSIEGFEQMVDWIGEDNMEIEVTFVMEATGVYYENLAYWLDSMGKKLSVLLPGKVKHYGRSLNIKTKTDNVDAQMLSRLGLERKLENWQMPSTSMREIKYLCREYKEIKAKLVVSRNQLHAKKHSHGCPQSVTDRLEKEIKLLEVHIAEIETELRGIVLADTALQDKVSNLTTIPGVGFMTVVSILAETNAFALVKNAKQLVSYAGLDIEHNQSGLKQGKTKISKKGNSFIRNALYMPALSASRYNHELNVFYRRLIEKKPAKKIGITAVARKLLVLIFTLWKNNDTFDPNIRKDKETDRVSPVCAG